MKDANKCIFAFTGMDIDEYSKKLLSEFEKAETQEEKEGQPYET